MFTAIKLPQNVTKAIVRPNSVRNLSPIDTIVDSSIGLIKVLTRNLYPDLDAGKLTGGKSCLSSYIPRFNLILCHRRLAA